MNDIQFVDKLHYYDVLFYFDTQLH